MTDIRKLTAAILLAPILAEGRLDPLSHAIMSRQGGSDEDRANILRSQRLKIARSILGCVEIAERLCEIVDAPAEKRREVADMFVGEPDDWRGWAPKPPPPSEPPATS